MTHPPAVPGPRNGSPGKSSSSPRSSLHPRNGAQSGRPGSSSVPGPRATTARDASAVMAYRRKQGIQRSATFVEDHRQTSSGGSASPAIASPRATRFADDFRRPERSSPLAAQQPLVSSRADLTLPSFGDRFPAAGAATAAAASQCDAEPSSPVQDPVTQLYTSTTSLNDEGPKYDLELSQKDTKHGFWGLVAQKAKVMLDVNGTPRAQAQTSESRWSYDRVRSSESQSPTARRGGGSLLDGRLDIGGKIKNVLEQEVAVTDSATSGGTSTGTHAGIIAARKLQIRRKACSMDFRAANLTPASADTSPMMADPESPQIKASRDVANAMAAKVKLLQRELKTVKADLAFSKERCVQLEEENRMLRDGNQDADEDLIRQQLETLLAEKARLANENTVYARENRFLREIVEYHQLDIEEEEEDDYDVDADGDDDEDAELEAEQCKSPLPSQLVLEEEEHQAADQGTEPRSPPSRHTESPRMLSTNSGGAGGSPDHESPRMVNTNGGGNPDRESPRMLNTDIGGNPEHESPRMQNADSGGTPGHESPRTMNTDSGGNPEHESPRMQNTDSGGTPGHESPRMMNTDSGGKPEHESPRMLNTDSSGTPSHESPPMPNTNSEGVGIVASESPRMLSTNSGGNTNESPRSFKDDGSSPETTKDG